MTFKLLTTPTPVLEIEILSLALELIIKPARWAVANGILTVLSEIAKSITLTWAASQAFTFSAVMPSRTSLLSWVCLAPSRATIRLPIVPSSAKLFSTLVKRAAVPVVALLTVSSRASNSSWIAPTVLVAVPFRSLTAFSAAA
mgnify:CR=1 FL=1